MTSAFATATPVAMSVGSVNSTVSVNQVPGAFLTAGRFANYGGPVSQWEGGIQAYGMSDFINDSPVGQPAGSWAVRIQKKTPATFNTPLSAGLKMDLASPGTTAYYINFEQGSGAVRGSIFTPGFTTTYATSSDYRLKENITPLDSDEELTRINQLRPRKWNWKDGNDPGIGFIAHEIQEVFDESQKLGIVSGSKDDVVRKGRIVDVVTGEPIWKETKIDDTTGEETITYNYVLEPSIEEAAQLSADGKEWQYTHDEPVYQTMDSSFLASSTIAAIQALTRKIQLLEERVAVLESV
jgi:hypothetical protein